VNATVGCSTRSTPSAAAIGIDASAAARAMSAAIMIGRRRSRSTHTPATSPKQIPASTSDAVTNATCSGRACRYRIAVNGNAVRPTSEPNTEIVCPAHSRTKSGCRQSPVNRGRT
jgi:hypothetical protein